MVTMLIISATGSQADQDFMLWLYNEFKPLMYSTARKYVSNSADCDDIIQDSLVKLIEKVDLLRKRDKCILVNYISYTVRNTAINYLKKQGSVRSHSCDLDDQLSEISSEIPSMDELMILAERKAQLNEIWDKLPLEDSVILSGKYILGYSDEILASQLQCKPSSIRMKLTRARRKAFLLLKERGDSE